MARLRKVHEGKDLLIECIIRVPNHANRSANITIPNYAGAVMPKDRNPESVEKQIVAGLKAIYGRHVRTNNDFSGSG
jgi:hypothetical protein